LGNNLASNGNWNHNVNESIYPHHKPSMVKSKRIKGKKGFNQSNIFFDETCATIN
jgi:hypothetical protein